ncbi:MAG: hypothetical protein OEZ13_06825 [Spirochaetia bacterium]|nr:hypothetical protein [Spirochaetia bacterium]
MQISPDQIKQHLISFFEKIRQNKSLTAYAAAILFGLGSARLTDAVAVHYISETDPDTVSMQPKNKLRAAKVANKRAVYDPTQIVGGTMFEKPEVSIQTKGADIAVEEDKAFTLIGTLEGPAVFARAVVNITGSKESNKEYGIGEKIGTARVIYIGREYIKVRRGGVVSKIEVGEKNMPGQPAAPAASSQSAGTIEKIISKEELKSKILGNEAAIYQGAAFGPKMENGKITGYRLHKLKPTHVFYSLGARAGDILRSVNGHSLSDTERMFELWKTIKTNPPSQLIIELERQKKPLTFKFHVRD